VVEEFTGEFFAKLAFFSSVADEQHLWARLVLSSDKQGQPWHSLVVRHAATRFAAGEEP
jgi:hypothetical protein